MTEKIRVYTIVWNEALFMPFFLRHYSSFADNIVVFDEASTDGTREIVRACPKAELRDWTFRGLDDEAFIHACNNWYKEARGQADWVMWPDCDELLYHPDPRNFLDRAFGDMIPARGYGMISELATPKPEEIQGQIYEDHRFNKGILQPNYDKWIIWRPGVDKRHTHGRHDRPQCSGSVSGSFQFKLLHYHYFGVEHTRNRNRRNYDRTLDKRFAWNYAPGMVNRGTETWVDSALKNRKTFDVIKHETASVHHRV